MEKFSYEAFWKSQEPQKKPHRQRADDLGLTFDEDILPVSPTLQPIRKNDIDTDDIEDWLEVQKKIFEKENELLTVVPAVKKTSAMVRQYETQVCFTPLGMVIKSIDISAFNTVDFLRDKPEFDKVRYAKEKIEDEVKNLAIMHSCITRKEGKDNIKTRYAALINRRYRDYGLRLLQTYKYSNDVKKEEIKQKIKDINRDIRRLNRIWKKQAYLP